MKICPCGQPLVSTKDEHYCIRYYNEKKEVIYEMCVHGCVIIDKRDAETYLTNF